MRILFDQGVPVPLRSRLSGHSVDTAFEQGWAELCNGELLQRAEEYGYQLLVTTDQHLQEQQNLLGKQLAVLVLLSTSWPRIQLRVDHIKAAIDRVTPSEFREVVV